MDDLFADVVPNWKQKYEGAIGSHESSAVDGGQISWWVKESRSRRCECRGHKVHSRLMEKFVNMGTLVECARMVRVSC